MTCYQRHMLWLFEALELPYDKDTRRRVDVALHEALGLDPSAHCPELWAAVNGLPADRLDALPAEVGALLAR